MLYRDIEFTVVRSLSPACWRWMVVLDHTEKAGREPLRELALLRARKFIDRLVESRQEATEQAEIKKASAQTP